MTDLYIKTILTLIALALTGLLVSLALLSRIHVELTPVACNVKPGMCFQITAKPVWGASATSTPVSPASQVGQPPDNGYSHSAREGLDAAVEKAR